MDLSRGHALVASRQERAAMARARLDIAFEGEEESPGRAYVAGISAIETLPYDLAVITVPILLRFVDDSIFRGFRRQDGGLSCCGRCRSTRSPLTIARSFEVCVARASQASERL